MKKSVISWTRLVFGAMLAVSVVSALVFVGCGGDDDDDGGGGGGGNHFNSNITYTSFTDSRDGKSYKSVRIGTQTWMAENLNYAGDGSNGDMCYEDKPSNCAKYGRLYTGESATYNSYCPAGWHVPSETEWGTLYNFVNGATSGGRALKAKSGWNNNGSGTDDYGFSALPGGRVDDDISYGAGNSGYWWTSTNATYGWNTIGYDINGSWNFISKSSDQRSQKKSIRCVQNN